MSYFNLGTGGPADLYSSQDKCFEECTEAFRKIEPIQQNPEYSFRHIAALTCVHSHVLLIEPRDQNDAQSVSDADPHPAMVVMRAPAIETIVETKIH